MILVVIEISMLLEVVCHNLPVMLVPNEVLPDVYPEGPVSTYLVFTDHAGLALHADLYEYVPMRKTVSVPFQERYPVNDLYALRPL